MIVNLARKGLSKLQPLTTHCTVFENVDKGNLSPEERLEIVKQLVGHDRDKVDDFIEEDLPSPTTGVNDKLINRLNFIRRLVNEGRL